MKYLIITVLKVILELIIQVPFVWFVFHFKIDPVTTSVIIYATSSLTNVILFPEIYFEEE